METKFSLMSKLAIVGAMGAMMSTESVKVRRVETKMCAECGNPHQHNNRWCSSECCKSYRIKHNR